MRATTVRANHKRAALFDQLQRMPLTAWQMAEISGMKPPVVESFIRDHLSARKIEVVGTGERKPGTIKGIKPKTYGAVDGEVVILLTGASKNVGAGYAVEPDDEDDLSAQRLRHHRSPPHPLDAAWFHKDRERCFLF